MFNKEIFFAFLLGFVPNKYLSKEKTILKVPCYTILKASTS
jgi:hypothetical protein